MSVHQRSSYTVPQRSKRVGRGTSFGTFGELLQGRLCEEHLDFLVTFPIACCSSATFISDSARSIISVAPLHKSKSQLLAYMLLEYYNLPCGGRLTIVSDLPVGKGLASSSADLVATARAISACFSIQIPCSLLQRLMSKIEPSDGVMYPGVVSFYHRQVQLREFLGPLPPLTVVSIDEGGELDTIQFNKRPKPFTTEEEQEYTHLLAMASAAVRKHDIRTLGCVATRSAILNQGLNPKRSLHEVMRIAAEVGGLGVIVAHSGTCLGILLSPRDRHYDYQLRAAREQLATLSDSVQTYHSFDFGVCSITTSAQRI